MRKATSSDIELAQKIQTAQKFLKDLAGVEYPNKVKPYIGIIDACMIKQNLDNELEAVLFISKLQYVTEGNILWLLAAAAEIIESK